MKYVAKPVTVEALQITNVGSLEERGIPLELEGGKVVMATTPMISRMSPQVGDYWVIQPDGYIYLNPKQVFKSKYREEKSK